MHGEEAIKKGAGVTAVKLLSNSFAGLKGTNAWAECMPDRQRPTRGHRRDPRRSHPNEPSGFITAVMHVENARPAKGRFIVIPRANASGFTHNDYSEGSPPGCSLPTPAGERWFRFGSRATNPIHQRPHPDIYAHPSGQRLSGSETRRTWTIYTRGVPTAT